MSTRLDPPISGTANGTATGGTVTTRTYADTGHETLGISNSDGDYSTVNAFSQSETHVTGALETGIYHPYYLWHYYSYKKYPMSIYDHKRKNYYLPVPTGLPNQLIAGTSPDRADVLLPAAVFELKDLPLAIYHAGRRLIKNGPKLPPKYPRKPGVSQASADWVALNFGWLPMIGDLKALVNFSELAAKREKEFDRLYSGRGLKRRHDLHSASQQQSEVYTAGSWGLQTASGTINQRIWGVVNWKPVLDQNFRPLARPTPNYVKRAVLGLNAANMTSNVWEAIPWSWFIDYFFNVQDFLLANNGLRTAVPTNCCIMVNHKTVLTSPSRSFVDQFGFSDNLSQGTIVAENKSRTAVYPEFIEAGFPTLSVKQLSILGALAVLKAPRL